MIQNNCTIYYVTTNTQKVETIQQYLQNKNSVLDIQPYSYDLQEIQAETQREVVEDKAIKAFHLLQKPVLVDDEGTFLDIAPNFPGVNTKYVMQAIGYEGFARFLNTVSKGGTFRVSLVYKDEHVQKIFEDSIHGTIVIDESTLKNRPPAFSKCFVPDGETTTYEELKKMHGIYFEKYHNFRIEAFKKFLTWYAKANKKIAT